MSVNISFQFTRFSIRMNCSNVEKVFKLRCPTHNNDWGKKGSNSKVAKLLKSADDSFHVDEDKHYAELWMGTHHLGPSYLYKNEEESLQEWITKNLNSLGSNDRRYIDGNLPFLFKVLSIERALAIQAHPNKAHAEQLHKERPTVYKDPNQKPEMAIAITPFKALVGIRPIKEIEQFVTKIQPLRSVLGRDNVIKLTNACNITGDLQIHKEAIKCCLEVMLTLPEDLLQREIENLLLDIKKKEIDDEDTDLYLSGLVHKLSIEYPGDVGIFMIYFLNLITLEPGEAIFIDTNVPHSYLSGDCVECMSCSHNVVRAGLTYKYRDIDNFCGMLDYTGRHFDDIKLKPLVVDISQYGVKETRFHPDIQDFSVSMIEISQNSEGVYLSPIDGPSICLICEGEGRISTGISPIHLQSGTVLFIAANEKVKLESQSNTMVLFRAYAGVET